MDKLVCVHWVDAESSAGWVDQKEIDEAVCPVVETVGWVVRDDEQLIALAQTNGGTDSCGVMYIPRLMVKDVIELEH
tara:strand:+ start:367 stop:597 length:231 start_codon:yes stop_codon:yes gene_type:complete